MLDIAWPELIVIGAVALVAIGPKDLPKVLYTVGRWAGKLRGAASDVRRAFDQLSYEARIAETLKQAPPTPPPSAAPLANDPDKSHYDAN